MRYLLRLVEGLRLDDVVASDGLRPPRQVLGSSARNLPGTAEAAQVNLPVGDRLEPRAPSLQAPGKARRGFDSEIAVPKARISTPAVPFPSARALARVAVSIRTLMIVS